MLTTEPGTQYACSTRAVALAVHVLQLCLLPPPQAPIMVIAKSWLQGGARVVTGCTLYDGHQKDISSDMSELVSSPNPATS